ncbi:hypothetical protein [Rhizosaccharibacter radicis]|uniref:Uncharacterized protein n=1 Tax=Rhizosaccharibacter radicis TaxID=2782605 RepID=A0ABT1W4C3_9PROT|nr:hypothetical protein [Acetobacteraceae bacterium KSS12]
MKIWSSHFDPAAPAAPPVLVPDGFCAAALFLGPLALLRPHGWLAALGTAAVDAVLLLLLRAHPVTWPLLAAFHLLLALFAHDLRRAELRAGGFVSGPAVAGASRDAALLRLLDRAPDMLRAVPRPVAEPSA